MPMLRFFRMTCQPQERDAVESLLQAEGYRCAADPNLEGGYILTQEPRPLGSSAAAAFGLIYILDRSSMLPPLCLGHMQGGIVLDMCASPGSKTGVLAQMVGERGLVVANEPNRKRYQTLRRNLWQMNLPQVVSTEYPAESFPDREQWPQILVDVPCSGWGTVDKHPRVLSVWREETLKPLLRLQRQILTRAAEILAPGGRLIYSTCTTNQQENEDQILWILEQEALGLEMKALPPNPGFHFDPVLDSKATGSLRVNGPASQGQSFFLACLCKSGPGSEETRTAWEGVDVGPEVKQRLKTEVDWQVLPPGRVEMEAERLMFKPGPALDRLSDFRWQGCLLGRGNKGLRLSARARGLVPGVEAGKGLVLTDIQQVQGLLQGQSLPAPGPGPLAPVYWHDCPLGWVTIKGRRCMWTDRI